MLEFIPLSMAIKLVFKIEYDVEQKKDNAGVKYADSISSIITFTFHHTSEVDVSRLKSAMDLRVYDLIDYLQ